jgi:hypothetical protein
VTLADFDSGFFRSTSRRALFGSLILFGLNAYICLKLFFTEYTSHLESIEAAYISISRYILQHPRAFHWFPLWYNGIPYQNTYPPLLHYLVAGAAWLFHISPALAHHAVSGAFYCLGPVTLFLMAGRISEAWGPSFIAAMSYSLVSPSVWLIPNVRGWAGSGSNVARLQSLVMFGDGPHVAALALLPLAILALHWALEKWSSIRVFTAAVALAAVVLTNWLGAFALAIAVVSYMLARAGTPGWFKLAGKVTITGAVAYALAAPWITLSTLEAVQKNAQYVIGEYPLTHKQLYYALALAAVALFEWWVLSRLRVSFAVRLWWFLLLFFAGLVLTNGWLGIYLMPQPHRYHLEFDLAFCLAAVFSLLPLWRRLSGRYQAVLLVLLTALAVRQTIHGRRIARRTIQPIDMSQTVEYQASRWLGAHMPDQRVFITGATQFWLNAFADTAQVGGGYGQGVTNPMIPIVHFGIPFTTGDGERTAMWLRLYGASAVVVSEANGRDPYKQGWHDPGKFHGVLPELWREGGDVIYAVPQRSDSLAHVIRSGEVAARSPENVADVQPVLALSKALEDPSLPLARFAWQGADRANITATMTPDELLFVQISYHPGWHAFVNGEERPLQREPLGMMLIAPHCDGPCVVSMAYDGGTETRVAEALRWIAIFAGVLWCLWELRSRRLRRAAKA